MTADDAARRVLRDLVDTALREGLVVAGPADAHGWSAIGGLRARLDATDGARLADGPGPLARPDDPVAAFDALGLDGPGRAQVRDDLADAVVHGAALDAALDAADPSSEAVLAAERRTARRGRPFLPTARAVSGWSAADVVTYGPARRDPLPLDWVAVRADHLREGPGAAVPLPEAVAGVDGAARVRRALHDRGLSGHRPLPVHPWHAEHVLPAVFAPEIAAGVVVVLGPDVRGAGAGRPTASWRTLDLGAGTHLKLPLGVATLGATRLLPARYLDNADRGEALLRRVLAADDRLAATVTVAGEGAWTGFAVPDGSDEFTDRPGYLAAGLRRIPVPGALALGGLAALDEDGHRDLATAFLTMGLGFLRHGVLPELHGQNVLVTRDGGFVLRDHDTVRVHRPWARDAGVGDPGYRIAPGARQSLVLDDPAELVGYLCTLGLQVTLGGLAHHHGLPADRAAAVWREALDAALAAVAPPPAVREVVVAVLDAPCWPHRTVLGPLLARGRSGGVSMPAATGSVGNPWHRR